MALNAFALPEFPELVVRLHQLILTKNPHREVGFNQTLFPATLFWGTEPEKVGN